MLAACECLPPGRASLLAAKIWVRAATLAVSHQVTCWQPAGGRRAGFYWICPLRRKADFANQEK